MHPVGAFKTASQRSMVERPTAELADGSRHSAATAHLPPGGKFKEMGSVISMELIDDKKVFGFGRIASKCCGSIELAAVVPLPIMLLVTQATHQNTSATESEQRQRSRHYAVISS